MKSNPPEWAIRTEADRRALASGYYWDEELAERPLKFAEKYIRPKYTGPEFDLFEWQKRFVRSIYGWRRPDGGRRFSQALLHVAKKNGKTLLTSILCAYELFAGVCPSPLVVSASTTKKNATQIFEQLQTAVLRNKKLKAAAEITPSDKLIKVPRADGEFWSMSSDAPGAEGWNISCGIIDEAHAHRSPKLYKTLEYGTTGRASGLIITISTAGDDLTHFYYGLLCRARRILSGEDTDPTFYAEVYEASEKDDLDSPETWKKANPSLDLYPGFTSEKFSLQWEAAKKSTADRLNFMRYRLNIFCRSEDTPWIDLSQWDECKGIVTEEELRAAPCWLALDASQRIDPTSLSAVWLLDGRRFFVRSWAWVAEEGVREREKGNLPKYAQFLAEKSMVMTPGGVIEKAPIAAKIRELRAKYKVKSLVVDPNGVWVLAAEIESEGLEVFRFTQSFRYFSDPTKELAAAVAARRLVHDGNSWLRYCIHSARLKIDDSGNCRPAKGVSADHIDGAVSAIMAFSLANQASAEIKPSGDLLFASI